jgi:acylphosphatase
MKRVLIRVSGLVQGVCFRRCTLHKAQELGLTGYVTNLANRQVEILAQGSSPAVEQLIDWLPSGVPAASVADIWVEEDEGDEIYLDFSIVQS